MTQRTRIDAISRLLIMSEDVEELLEEIYSLTPMDPEELERLVCFSAEVSRFIAAQCSILVGLLGEARLEQEALPLLGESDSA